jgi:hypothetical protein
VQTLKSIAQEALDSLEVQGLLRKTGDLRQGNDGDIQPIYVRTVVSEWLDKTGLMGEFLAFLDARSAWEFKRTSGEALLKIEN